MMTVDGATDKYQRQAEDCAWYLLATIYGEDHPKNRFSWNRYVAAYLDDKRRTALREQGFPESELNPFTSEELVDLKSAYARRCKPGSKIDLPQPTPPFEGAPHPVIDFSHVQLDKFFRARGFLFPEMVQFWGAIFHDSASFGEATFDEAAIFGKAQFAGANFDGATFNGSAHFDDTDFQLIPPGYLSISFERAKFAQYVTFERAIISDISFANAIFSGAISRFDEAAFGDGDFSNVVFKHPVVFENATFRRARFDGGIFEGEADFGGARFGDPADAWESAHSDRFREPAFFVGTKFNSKVSFAKAAFCCRSTFVNSEMAALTSFVGAKFSEWSPLFFGSKLHEGTYWHGVEWPPRPQKMTSVCRTIRWQHPRMLYPNRRRSSGSAESSRDSITTSVAQAIWSRVASPELLHSEAIANPEAKQEEQDRTEHCLNPGHNDHPVRVCLGAKVFLETKQCERIGNTQAECFVAAGQARSEATVSVRR
jgi:uncharacterized protein YjbI with pentapeptide repeats